MNNAQTPAQTAPQTFQALFCEAYRCRPDNARRRMFWLSLHRRAWPLAVLIMRLRPRFFEWDLQLLDEAAQACDINELVAALNGFRQECSAKHSFIHDDLRIRISGKRLISVFNKAKLRTRQAKLAARS
jgi:hypothetical protein